MASNERDASLVRGDFAKDNLLELESYAAERLHRWRRWSTVSHGDCDGSSRGEAREGGEVFAGVSASRFFL